MTDVSLPASVQNWLLPHRAEIAAGLTVGRALPFRGGKGVGPFVFLDHIGPHVFPAGSGTDVLPHPHIGLSTVTYLFEGALDHRDSLGTVQRILPGDVNWMTAGKGIVHSERSPQELRHSPQPFHGLQAWVALPVESEEVEPSFEHWDRTQLPTWEDAGAKHTLIAGEAFGRRSPVRTYSRLFYVSSELSPGASIRFDPQGQDAAFYLVSGSVSIEGKTFTAPGLLFFQRGIPVDVRAESSVRGALLGGDPLPEHRRIWWNFVSSSPERVEAAKRRWKAREFPPVPGETDFIPLPG